MSKKKEFKYSSKDEMFLALLETLVHWNYNLSVCEANEEYEICIKIQTIIENKVLEFGSIMENRFQITDKDIERFDEISSDIIRQINGIKNNGK